MVTTTRTCVQAPCIAATIGIVIERLLSIKGTTFIQLHANTEFKMNKGGRSGIAPNRLHGKITKHSIVNAIVGFSYENMVNNARGRKLAADVKQACLDAGVSPETLEQFKSEVSAMVDSSVPEFTPARRAWGKHCEIGKKFNPVTCTIEPIFSKIMIEHKENLYIQIAVLSSQKPTYTYTDSGLEVSEADMAYAKSYVTEKTEGARQGLKNPIIIRDYKIENVTRIHLNKMQYKIVS